MIENQEEEAIIEDKKITRKEVVEEEVREFLMMSE